MKIVVLCVVLVFGFWACDTNGKTTTKADTLQLNLDTTLNKLGDSIEAKGERTLDTLKAKFNDLRNRKETQTDSAR